MAAGGPKGRPGGAVRVAVLGAGTVGSEVVRMLVEHSADFAQRVGAPLELAGIAVRDGSRARHLPVDRELVTTDAAALVARPDVDVVIELIGGVEPARQLLLAALHRGASVVTANKAVLAADGAALHDAARGSGADLYFEASVAGAIPLLRPIRESLAGDRITRVLGIVNGTCNYVLTRMDEDDLAFDEALAAATALGYAETDPTADISGADAAAKTAILAALAFHTRVALGDVYCEGITAVTPEDVAAARDTGTVIKLLAVAEMLPGGRAFGVRVHPAMVPRTHPLAAVRDAFNAVYVEGAAAGPLMFYGRGAGGAPTASAVLGDLVAVARNRLTGARGPGESAYAELQVAPVGDARTRYFVRLEVEDKPGVLASVATAYARHDVSIRTVRQEGHGADATLVLISHVATEAQLSATVADLRGLPAVRAVLSVLRVEGLDEP